MDMFAFDSGSNIAANDRYLSYMETLLENIDDALIATDEQFVITHWNKAAERIYNIKAAEAIGAHRADLLRYEYVDSSLFELAEKLKTYDKWNGVLKFTRKDNSVVFLQSSATALKNEYGNVVGYVAINRDITQQYVSEQSPENFTAILHLLDESFLIVDRNMQVVFLSAKKNVVAFHNSDYKTGDHALKFIPDAQRSAVVKNYLKAFGGATISHEVASDDVVEERIYLHVTYMPVKNSYGAVTHVAVIIKDLTEEKRRALAEQKEERNRRTAS